MFKNIRKNQRGDITIVVVIILVLLVIGGGAYWFLTKDKESDKSNQLNTNATPAQSKAALDACLKAGGDNDICKFSANFSGLDGAYTMDMTGESFNSKFSYDGKGNSKMESAEGSIVYFNGASYIQNGDKWIKYPGLDEENETPVDVDKFTDTFDIDENTPENSIKDTYKSLGKEACGNLECFKYQIYDSGISEEGSTLIWFDTKEYKLRRMETTDTDGAVHTIAFSYGNVTITEPTPYEEMYLPDFN